MSRQPTIYIIAGPNGAGKTSFAEHFLPDFVECREFLNADLIAAGLAPFAPESQAVRASQLMLEQIHRLVGLHRSFSVETTLSGRSYRQQIPRWQLLGFQITLLFLWLPSDDMAVERVASRVRQGGHNIPEPDIRRRYARGIHNLFRLYLPIIDAAYIYNASVLPPSLVWRREGKNEKIMDQDTWRSVSCPFEEPT